MTETRTRTPEDLVARDAAEDIIGSFRSVAPSRKSHQDSYICYLDRIQDRLKTFTWRKSKNGNHIFGANGGRLPEISFTPESITWTWKHVEKGISTVEKSVRFFLEDEQTMLELKVTPIATRTDTKSSSPVVIVIGNQEDVLLIENGIETRVPFDEAIGRFPRPKK